MVGAKKAAVTLKWLEESSMLKIDACSLSLWALGNAYGEIAKAV